MPDGYVYAADVICAPCAQRTREELKTAEGWTFHQADEDNGIPDLWRSPDGTLFNVGGDVATSIGTTMGGTDTDTFPAGPYPDGTGESDCPQHCHDCGVFLENPLTKDGERYVFNAACEASTEFFTGGGNKALESVALKQWLPFYRESLTLDGPAHATLDLFDAMHRSSVLDHRLIEAACTVLGQLHMLVGLVDQTQRALKLAQKECERLRASDLERGFNQAGRPQGV